MSEIPPDLPSSAAQTGVQARQVAKQHHAHSAGPAEAAKRQVKSVDEAGSTVETTDDDVAIFADAEGTGSQGRESEERTDTGPQSTSDGASPGITKGEDGRIHVDLEA